MNNLDKELGAEEAKRFERNVVPEGIFLICETERTKYPTMLFEDLRRKVVSEWLPSSGAWAGRCTRSIGISLVLQAWKFRGKQLSLY